MNLVTGWLRRGPHSISPTAHYTGYVWAHHGLGTSELATTEGRLYWGASRVALAPVERLGGPTLEHFLLARHRIIDLHLRREIAAGRVGTIVELAAGMSPRGHDFSASYPDLTYVEVDLPAMVERKRGALERIGGLGDRLRLRVESADVMDPAALAAVFARLDHDRGVAVVTEGLLNYFPTETVERLWTGVATALRGFPHGVYLSDLHLQAGTSVVDQAFATALSVAVRGRVHFHYADALAAADALRAAGFPDAAVREPVEYDAELPGMRKPGASRVRVLEAHTG